MRGTITALQGLSRQETGTEAAAQVLQMHGIQYNLPLLDITKDCPYLL